MTMRNSRRNFIKKSVLASVASTSSLSFTSNLLNDKIIGHGDFKFKLDKKWSSQDIYKHPVNHCHEMVIDSGNKLYMTTTHVKNNILVYNRDGKILDSYNLNLPGAHGLTLSNEGGDEFLYVTDPDNNKFCKTTLKGEKIFEFEAPKEISEYTSNSMFKPTEITVASNGDFYVADGYGLDFIIQYDYSGKYIRHFGGRGNSNNQFDCCHGVTIDTRDSKNPFLLITSRSKNEFKRFTMDGKWMETIKMPGCYICRPVIKDDHLAFAVIVTKDWGSYDGMLAVLDNNYKVVSMPGGNSPKYIDNLLQRPAYDNVSFRNPHDVCIDNDWNVYVPQWNSGKIFPIKLTRV